MVKILKKKKKEQLCEKILKWFHTLMIIGNYNLIKLDWSLKFTNYSVREKIIIMIIIYIKNQLLNWIQERIYIKK